MTTRPAPDSRVLSHGRGGAGKLSSHDPFLQAAHSQIRHFAHLLASHHNLCRSPVRVLTTIGNIIKDDPTANYPKAEDLVTPTLKSNTYTTGRGGTGNMAQNDPSRPEIARAAQDVDAPIPAGTATHYGRGGAANIIDKKEGVRKSGDGKRNSEDVKRDESAGKGGLLAKGKDLLNKLSKK
jgi:hypothetical protein